MPMTSLIDIVFMLLIYFLLTTNFMVDEGIKIKNQAVKVMDIAKAAGAGRLCLATEKEL
ncbi:ExbD/TolR family protein [Desulfosarcina ovata]|uniref:Biopolymer transporter ExbD n=1 Tax=Desulfosarcina ovata subsp. ovata TaxID=2752305 RepID=A0A5K8ADX6_9BACT|nr:biopolymer transporter ExbD [Desulfosarcina ovata]BBO90150.1 hypothetical protein DSCOOX_33300 [Desulfosarcina ovata subsp. ovata]